MTFTIGYPIHNKGYMIDEIINGLAYSIGDSDHEIKYRFILDGCTDKSKEVLEKLMPENSSYIETDNLFQLKTNNILVNNFDTDFLVIFQDDMVLRDTNFLDNILRVYERYGDKLGLLGCRDGFNEGFSDMCGSHFSASARCKTKLGSGINRERMMVNIGPIVFTQKLVEKMGCFDEIYTRGTYEEMEYSLKCTLAGLKTVVMGVDLTHSKFTHKNRHHIEHTSQNVLNEMYAINGQIFEDRWYNVAKIKKGD